MVTYRKEDLTNPTVKNFIVATINDAVKGGFMRLNEFQSKSGHGEIQNATYCKGIDYGAAVERSLAMIDEMESDTELVLTVKRGTWQDENGNINPTNRKSKAFPKAVTVTEVVKSGDADLLEAFAKLRQSLESPAPSTSGEYEKLGNGIYQNADGVLYIRDLRLVQKTVVVKGDYPFTASGKINAIVDVIKRDTPVGKYRMVRMDGDFKSISLGGKTLAAEVEEVETFE